MCVMEVTGTIDVQREEGDDRHEGMRMSWELTRK